MKIETWMVTAAGIVVAAVVTLMTAYLARKQARQIELFRQDPSRGVTPPPHPITLFFKKNWFHFIFIIGIVYFFCRWIQEERRHSYYTGVVAALFLYYITLYIVTWLVRRTRTLVQDVDWVTEDTHSAIKIIAAQQQMLVALIEDLGSQHLLSENGCKKIDAAIKDIKTKVKTS